jgi:hypothetical protein
MRSAEMALILGSTSVMMAIPRAGMGAQETVRWKKGGSVLEEPPLPQMSV